MKPSNESRRLTPGCKRAVPISQNYAPLTKEKAGTSEREQWVQAKTIIFCLVAALCLTPWANSSLALSAGFILAITIGNPFPKTTKLWAKNLLKVCVVLLGFRLNFGIVLEAGSSSIIFTALSIAATFAVGRWLGRLFNVPGTTSMLISAGTAICGGSAIAAVSTALGAVESEMTVALGTVFLLNAAALYIFAPLGDFFHLTQGQFGVWAGLAIHDVSSVVGAASQFGPEALETATVVKLSRSLWILPISLAIAYLAQNGHLNGQKISTRPPDIPRHKQDWVRHYGAAASRVQVPWFIGFFLLASLSQTFVPEVAVWSPVFVKLSRVGFNLTLFAIGTGLSLQALKRVGWRALVQGALLWLFAGAGSFWIVRQFGVMSWGVMG
ncbi:YeiH family protein [Synechococcus sp. PCC 7336]|uniref:YeiH family protein n=1 Tax=Synechococcus sp. PCC 7336 TaxID=195250 RepID=UPI0003483C45|nr:putative sulfate exporter family transporter [Synechococcus sp. PCC 7336]